jgi:hypothetical protein
MATDEAACTDPVNLLRLQRAITRVSFRLPPRLLVFPAILDL